jgi:hypothetical protein
LARQLIDAFPRTGLWPVVLQDADNDAGEPWLTGDFDRAHLTRVTTNPASAFAGWWSFNIEHSDTDDRTVAASFGESFPGLGAPKGPVDEGAVPGTVAGLGGRLGLVAVTRPADVTATIGWLGATNYIDGGAVSVALRSWEERYGAEPVRIGQDYVELAVRNPPRTTRTLWTPQPSISRYAPT